MTQKGMTKGSLGFGVQLLNQNGLDLKPFFGKEGLKKTGNFQLPQKKNL